MKYSISQINFTHKMPETNQHVVRVPVRTREEAEFYSKHDVTVFQMNIEGRSFCYIEVAIEDLAKVARKG